MVHAMILFHVSINTASWICLFVRYLFVCVPSTSVLYVFVCVRVLQRARRNIFPLLRGAAVLLSQTRSRAGHCICVLCITSCVRLWIVSETMVCFALKGHLNHLPLGCKCRRIQRCCPGTICIFPPVLSLDCSLSRQSTQCIII